MTAHDVLTALLQRHSDCLCVPECHDGPTGNRLARIDLWAMSRSWARPRIYGYEIKVSRQDFLRDDKWQAYLPMCTDLYFACPHGLIQPEELPSEVGLLWMPKSGTRFTTKRKAAWRQIDPPWRTFKYILMSRTIIGNPGFGDDTRSALDYWRHWLTLKEENRELGHRVGRGIRKALDAQVHRVEAENRVLKTQIKNLEAVAQMLRRLDIPESQWAGYSLDRAVEQKIKRANAAVPPELRHALEDVVRQANITLTRIKELTQQ